ncbi:hypothetical protein J8380_00845 [Candidatus Thiothrix anitrata]|uniref:SD-repeat containing protein B domain-containing protein n=1 Tax=Candidatus Thiothrix anitrata TaxID=2823902 RepID=A0ABX7X313_9GAMM|nr:hypothetical protein J8380_00845 [Candidatus Thiothrix anitrata]
MEDAPETGVIGVSVSLINTATQAVVATTTTGADGVYTFTGVLPVATKCRCKSQRTWALWNKTKAAMMSKTAMLAWKMVRAIPLTLHPARLSVT